VRHSLFVYCIGFCLFLGCTTAPSAPKTAFKIVTTTQMLADAISPHLNSSCSIVVLFPEGIDPHSYRPVPSDIKLLQEADAVLYNGLHLEANMESMLEHLGRSKPCISLGFFIPHQDLIPLDEHSYDPHIWFDITLFGFAAMKAADSLGKALSKPVFLSNQTHLDSLVQLDSLLLKQWQNLPESQRVLCSVHDAFSYYCRKYKLKQISLQGVSTAAEFGIYEVNDMVDFIVENKARVAFTEAHALTKAMKSVQMGCAKRGHKLTIGEPLLTDAPGKKGSLGGSWPGMVIENSDKIQKAFSHD